MHKTFFILSYILFLKSDKKNNIFAWKEKRQFVIKVYSKVINTEYCIKNIYGNLAGYLFLLTINKEKIKIWTIRKNCEKAIEKLQN